MKKILAVVSILIASTYLFAGTLINVPALTSPENDKEDLMPIVLLDWDAVAGSVDIQYEIQLDVNSDFSDPELFSTDVTSYSLPQLKLNTSYYWRVRGVDGDEVSEWSEERVFHVIDKFVNSKPTNNKTGILPIDILEWNADTYKDTLRGIEMFEIMIDTVLDFNSAELMAINVKADTVINVAKASVLTEELLFNTSYFWRVRAYNADSETEWSDATKFTTLDLTRLTVPRDGDIVEPIVNFKWQSKKWGLFLLQLSEDEEFTNPVNILSEEYNIFSEPFTFGQTYYWRVALVSNRDTSLFTEARSFVVLNAPELDSPGNNETNVSIYPELIWDAIDGATKYKLHVSIDDPGFGNPMQYNIEATGSSSKESFMIAQPIDSAKNVYWRVKAFIDTSQESEWSEEWLFTIAATGIEEAATNKFVVFPNPNNGQFILEFNNAEGSNVELQIIDMIGKVVYEESLNFANGSAHNISASLPEGIYILQLRKGDDIYTDKITIR